MKFVRVIKGYEHLWAVKEPDKEHDELTSLFEKWNNADYLLDFFIDNIEDLKIISMLKKFQKPYKIHLKMQMNWKK